MLTIHDRSFSAVDRSEAGHWEGDLIIGNNHLSAIGTLVERQTRMLRLVHLPRSDADSLHAALVARMKDLPPTLMRSITWDQGTEMARHLATTDKLGAPVYFCDSRSPWQRGTNENTYWYTVLVPGRFDGSQPVGCWVTRRTRVADGFPLICPRQLRARALTGSDLIEAC
ncbi:transposase [Mycobacterium intracellulare subsp. chimaera]|uniref:Transposase n=2 Tax=Mycobacterium TaxID=1763 RepID=A0A7U5MH81_MYCIT|nr:transposase [Mycobacterium intracellulare subsp. chimaera]ASL13447.1 transposase [Mycobacterium intracellulare subsp. chimaera]